MDGDIPLWIKIAYTGLLIVVLPVYAKCYGWRNFLWFSDIALIAIGIALWLESPLIASMMAVGVLLPAMSLDAPGFLVSAILVGGTFVGVVTIAMPAAKRIATGVRFNMMAAMTAAYGVGQIAGPLVSSALLKNTNSSGPPLLAAGGGLVIATLGCMVKRTAPRTEIKGRAASAKVYVE